VIANNNFRSNSLASIISVVVNILAPIVIISLLTTKLGISYYGQYVVILSLLGIFTVVSDLGLSMEIPKLISRDRYNDNKVATYVGLYIFCKSIAGILLALPLYMALDGSQQLKTLIILFFIMKVCSPEILFIGLERYYLITQVTFISKLFLLILILSIDLSENGLEKLFTALFIVTFLLNLFLYLRLFLIHKVKVKPPNLESSKKVIRSSLGYYRARFFLNLYSQGSTYALSYFLSIDKVAIYSIAIDAYKLGGALIGAVGRVLFTSLALKVNFELLKKATLFCLVIHLTLMAPIYIFGESLLDVIFQFDVEKLFQASFILYVALSFTIINSFWGYPAFSPIDKENLIHTTILLTSISYYIAVSILILTDNITIFTVVLCIVLAEFIGVVLRVIHAVNNNLLP
jgi:O-antigen/teichoic acid export membrane protein